MLRSWRTVAAVLVGIALLTMGCGEADTAPDAATIEFQPTAFERTLGSPTCSAYQEGPVIRMVLRNGDDVPLNDLEITVTRSNTNVAFYVNGVRDPVRNAISAITDDNGVATFKIAIFDCAGKTALEATSGTAFESADITVTAGTGGGNAAPTATATVNPGSGTAGVTSFAFDGSGSADSDGTIVSYDWDFGDGNTATGVTASHTYAAAGSYTATLTVTDDGGATASTTVPVTVTP